MGSLEQTLEKIPGNNLKVAFINRLSIKEPLDIGYLSSYIQNSIENIDVKLFDPRIDPINSTKDYESHFVLYSVMSSHYRATLIITDFSDTIKKVVLALEDENRKN